MIPNPPNILIVHCHDLGQYLHCYGVETVQTPNLDAFAAEGVRFERSFCAAPSCSPSRASIFTGRYPHSNGVMGLCHANFAWDLHPEERHLAQLLDEAGYVTAAVGVIHETHSGAARCGYQSYDPPNLAMPATDAAIARLEQLRGTGRPFLMSVGFFEPHRLPAPGADPPGEHGFASTWDSPSDSQIPGYLRDILLSVGFIERGPLSAPDAYGFTPPQIAPDSTLGTQVPGYLRDTPGTRQELAELQGAVRHVDTQFGRLMAALDELGLRQDTLVIFTTDHGVAMPRAKCSLYGPGISVAFMLRLPARPGWHGGVIHAALVSNVDYLPTLLDLLDLPIPPEVQGRSLTALLDGAPYTARSEIFAEMTYHDYYDPRRCIRTATHKLIANFTTAPFFMDPSQSWRPRADTLTPPNHAVAFHPHIELYDLRCDPWEQENLADKPEHTAIQRELLRRLHQHLVETADPILAGAVTGPHHRAAQAYLEQA